MQSTSRLSISRKVLNTLLGLALLLQTACNSKPALNPTLEKKQKKIAFDQLELALKDKDSSRIFEAMKELAVLVAADPEQTRKAVPLFEEALGGMDSINRCNIVDSLVKVAIAGDEQATQVMSLLEKLATSKTYEDCHTIAVRQLYEVAVAGPTQASKVLSILKKVFKGTKSSPWSRKLVLFNASRDLGGVVKGDPSQAPYVLLIMKDAITYPGGSFNRKKSVYFHPKEKNMQFRCRAARTLAAIARDNPTLTSEVLTILEHAITAKNKAVRSQMKGLITKVANASPAQTKEALLFIKKMLEDKDKSIRNQALCTLPEIVKGDPTLIPEVLVIMEAFQFIHSKNSTVRSDAANLLRDMVSIDPDQAEKLFPLLEEALNSKYADTRQSVVNTLEVVLERALNQAEKMLPLLEEALNNKYEDVRRSAVSILESVVRLSDSNNQAKEAGKKAREMLEKSTHKK